jgi:hypothetical protein
VSACTLTSRASAQRALLYGDLAPSHFDPLTLDEEKTAVTIDFKLLRVGIVLLGVACGAEAAPDNLAAGSSAPASVPTGTIAGSSPSTGNTAGTVAMPAASGGSGAVQSGGAGGASGKLGTHAAAGTSAAAGGGTAAGRGGSTGAGAAGSSGVDAGGGGANVGKFSFFVSSYAAMQRLSGSPNGFGGDLRFKQADGLSGADEICRQIAETALLGAGSKTWHAFLSVTKGPDGKPVNAIERVGDGPWYDRLGRLVALNKADLAQDRPKGADPAIINDLPNEDGVPNHAPNGGMQVDNHHVLTGSSATGMLNGTDWSVTCHDWTSSVGADGKPRVGVSWPRMGTSGGSANWMSALSESGCAAGASLVEMGGPMASNPTVGSGGGYGAIYCFGLTP